MTKIEDIEALVAQYAQGALAIEIEMRAATLAAYETLDWYDTATTTLLASATAARVSTGLAYMAGLAQQFVELTLSLMGVPPVERPASTWTHEYPRAGVDPFTVYSRPVFAYREAVGHGADFEQALGVATARFDGLVATDAALVRRQVERDKYRQAGVTKYRRVIRPERSKGGSCELCVAASQRVYKIKDLLPIHHLCKCLTLPIYGEFDPGNTLNLEDLLPEGVTAGAALKRTRYKVGESGELGPVLIPASMTRRTAAAPAWDSPERASKELAALEPVLESLQQRASAGEDVAGPLEWQQDQIARLRRIVAA